VLISPTNSYTDKTVKNDLSSNFSSSYEPFFVSDSTGKNTILYWPTGYDTMITVFANTSSKLSLGIEPRLVQFIYPEDEKKTNNTVVTKSPTDDGSDKMLDDYLKWSNYMLKTEVVPPVCPACPSCNAGGVCSDCGGNGGCGTKAPDGKSLAYNNDNSISDVKGPSSAVASVGKSAASVANTAGNLAGGTVNAIGNLAGGTVNAVGNLAGGTIGTAADLLKSTGSGLSNFLSQCVWDTINHTKEMRMDIIATTQEFRGIQK